MNQPDWNLPYAQLTALVSMIWLGLLIVLILLSWTHAFTFLVGSFFAFAMLTYTSRARNEIL